MNEARQAFETLLVSKGKPVPEWDGKKYVTVNVQSYWRWFLLGWHMKRMNGVIDNAVLDIKRTNQEKERAVRLLLEDPELRQWSDSEVARHASVSHTFVANIRNKMESEQQ